MANPLVQQINTELELLQKELGQFKTTVSYLNDAKIHVKEAVKTVNHAEENFIKKIDELKSTYSSIISLTVSIKEVVAKIETINFPERLDNIEKTVKTTISILNDTRKETIDELKKASEAITNADFDGKFKKLQISIDSSIKTNDELANTIQKQKLPEKIDGFEKNIIKKLDYSISDLQKNTKLIASETEKSIRDLNLPIRIDKLDATISGILNAVQNVQNRIESVERNIGDRLKEANEKQETSFANFQEKTNQSILEIKNELSSNYRRQQINTYITWGFLIISLIVLSILKTL